MRLTIVLLLVFVALNIGARCRIPAEPVPSGCERLGGSGLVHCRSQVTLP
jgi:hypothetical protein